MDLIQLAWRIAVAASVVVSSLAQAQKDPSDPEEKWLPVICKAANTVGLHDEPEPPGEQLTENFEFAAFQNSVFELRENTTFTELLGETEQLHVSLREIATDVVFELTCDRVLGRTEERGYVCTTIPAQDVLMINPASKRFTRAMVGAWTFAHPSDLETGASLIVEHGTCEKMAVTEQNSEEERQ